MSRGQPYDKFQITTTTIIIILTISSRLYLHTKLCQLHICVHLQHISCNFALLKRRGFVGFSRASGLWWGHPCLLSSFGNLKQDLETFFICPFIIINFLWNWKGAKKILGHFKEKGRNMIDLDWIGLHYLNAQCSQLPTFYLFLKKWTNA
jgi:hypothetical protein